MHLRELVRVSIPASPRRNMIQMLLAFVSLCVGSSPPNSDQELRKEGTLEFVRRRPEPDLRFMIRDAPYHGLLLVGLNAI